MTVRDRTAPTTRSPTLALLIISIAQLMLLVDATIVNVTLPNIQHALGFSGAGLEWVVTGYSIMFGGLLLFGGRAGDVLGRRRVFLSGLTVFTLASLAGGFATQQWWLIGCRALQGIGASASSPAALSLIASTFPEGARRDRAIGFYSAAATAGGAIGLLAGGVISTYLSWRWVMFVNVPIGVFVIVAGSRVLTETERVRGRFDLAGAVTGTLGVTLLVYGLITGATDRSGVSHWHDPAVLVTLGCAVVMLVAFWLIEKRSRYALVPLRVLADRTRSGILVVSALNAIALVGLAFFLTIFVQEVWRYSPLHTALVYLPLTALLVAGSRVGAWLMTRVGARRLIVCGFAVGGAGMFWLSWIGDAHSYLTGMLIPTVLTYAGIGVTPVPLTVLALAGAGDGEAGLASGLVGAAAQVGSASGLAVLGTVTWATVASVTASRSHSGESAASIATHALAVGVSRGIAVAAGLMLLSLFVVLATVRRD
ncbi:MAG TPA: MFS transporter [Pseudonocardiaceae bacterium]|jgi:EmrB/QacA subfamily drug resistance transporter|nr:MFS transporter [Pseudonocardiaceae bacterium]